VTVLHTGLFFHRSYFRVSVLSLCSRQQLHTVQYICSIP